MLGSFYLLDHGCLVQLVLSVLAHQATGQATCSRVLPKGYGRKEKGKKRNALIATRIQTVWENLFEKCLGNKTKANRKETVWSSGLGFALLPHSTCVADTLNWALALLGQWCRAGWSDWVWAEITEQNYLSNIKNHCCPFEVTQCACQGPWYNFSRITVHETLFFKKTLNGMLIFHIQYIAFYLHPILTRLLLDNFLALLQPLHVEGSHRSWMERWTGGYHAHLYSVWISHLVTPT